jgi:REP element-mobilizing transposase RayT
MDGRLSADNRHTIAMTPENTSLHGPHRLAHFDYANSDHAYFVTARARMGAPFADPRLATIVVDSLTWMRIHRRVSIYAYCLMPDHLHLLVQLPSQSPQLRQPPSGRPRPAANRDPQGALGTIIGNFKSFTTNRSWNLGYKGQLWQARFYDHIVRRSEDGLSITRYILDNPVRKGFVEDWSMWRWSGTPDPLVG